MSGSTRQVPTRSSWFWGESKDVSKSKCGCFLVDSLLTAESTDETEGQMCSYAPMQVDSAKVESSMSSSDTSERYVASDHAGKSSKPAEE